MGVEDHIFRLMIKEDNKLFKKRANSFDMVHKTNIMEQVARTYNIKKKKKLVVKGKGIAKKLNGNFFICNKVRLQTNDCKKRAQQENLKKIITLANITEVDHLINEVLEMNLFTTIFKVNMINKPE